MLMPVEFPRHLVIATRGIEVWDGVPEQLRRTAVVYGITMPVGGRADGDISIAEQIVTAVQDPLCVTTRRGTSEARLHARGHGVNSGRDDWKQSRPAP